MSRRDGISYEESMQWYTRKYLEELLDIYSKLKDQKLRSKEEYDKLKEVVEFQKGQR